MSVSFDMMTCAAIWRIIHIHLMLPPASCCILWINYHDNLKTVRNIIKQGDHMLQYPSLVNPADHKKLLHNYETSQSQRQQFTCTLHFNMNVHVTDGFLDASYTNITWYIKTYWRYLHVRHIAHTFTYVNT